MKLDNKKKAIAECVGLWLAEGNNKCKNEITFTNNEFTLIKYFHKILSILFPFHISNIRLYIYSHSKQNIETNLNIRTTKYYVDKRANKPYYMWRLASVHLYKKWKTLVEYYKSNPKFYADILRGFFAGEGNIKSGSHCNRAVRISQKKSRYVEYLLDYFEVEFSYYPKERSYCIFGKWNWDKLAEINIANLHPIKKEKFWKIYNEFQEEHYKKGYLKKAILHVIDKPYTTRELSAKFNRSMARVQDILLPLKKQGKVLNFRVGSTNYWTKNHNIIVISRLKKKYLNFLNGSKHTSHFAKKFKVCRKSSYNRLKELEKLQLVKVNSDGKWIKLPTKREVVVK